MARIPQAASRRRIGRGLGATRQAHDNRAGSAGRPADPRPPTSTPRPCGSADLRGTVGAAAAATGLEQRRHLAREPACDSASGRFGVTFTSRTSSSSPRWRARSAPSGHVRRQNQDAVTFFADAPARSRCRSSPATSRRGSRAGRASCRPAASRPAAPRPPGRRGPDVGRAADDLFFPGAARHQAHDRSLSAAGCGRMPSTSATTTPVRSRPRRSIASTSSPASDSFSATLSAVTPGLRSQSSRSQLKEIFTGRL